MNTIKTEKLDTRDFITIGIFASISLVIFFVIGGAAGMTLVGTVANIPITVFFTSIAYKCDRCYSIRCRLAHGRDRSKRQSL